MVSLPALQYVADTELRQALALHAEKFPSAANSSNHFITRYLSKNGTVFCIKNCDDGNVLIFLDAELPVDQCALA
jgi:hypothetical protein